MIELTLRLVDLRLGLQILRVLGDRNVRVAGEPGELHLRLLTEGFELVLVEFESEARLVVAGLGYSVGPHQRREAVIGRLIELDLAAVEERAEAIVVGVRACGRGRRDRRCRAGALASIARDVPLKSGAALSCTASPTR